MVLDERKKKVLQAIIEDYVVTAEPVGSRTISRKYQLGVSPATIRNEMADLEELGYIEQPHTSAGRIPSSRGYRFYVDYLMQKEPPPVEAKTLLDSVIDGEVGEIDDMLQQTARLLTAITNYPALVSTSAQEKRVIRCLQVLPLNDTQGIVVLVNESGNVESDVIDLPSEMNRDELDIISHILTEKFKGVVWETNIDFLVRGVEREVFRYKVIFEQVCRVLKRKAKKDLKEKVYLEGTTRILNQPEFRDLDRLQAILGILEEENALRAIMVESQGRGITAKIGEENDLAQMSCCSIVTAPYKVNDDIIGTVGVLGPTRMDYKRVFAIVEYISNNLEQLLSAVRK